MSFFTFYNKSTELSTEEIIFVIMIEFFSLEKFHLKIGKKMGNCGGLGPFKMAKWRIAWWVKWVRFGEFLKASTNRVTKVFLPSADLIDFLMQKRFE